jgi:hypothetical protein
MAAVGALDSDQAVSDQALSDQALSDQAVFDRVVMVDWSANNGPKWGRDSIWVGDGDVRGALSSRNYPTRRQAHDAVVAVLDRSLERAERVLLGYDFSFGYPVGFASHFPGPARPWERIWEHMEAMVTDTDGNVTNRFQVANDINATTAIAFYWGSPALWPALAPRLREPPPGLRANPLAAYRHAEVVATAQVKRPIRSAWQLGNGVSVGSQVLTGLPYLQRLRRRYGRALAVWPQETGFVDDPLGAWPGISVVLAEIWPTAFLPAYTGGTRDEEQVRWAVQCCLHQQHAGRGLRAWFNPASVAGAGPVGAGSLVDEEGWILGVC